MCCTAFRYLEFFCVEPKLQNDCVLLLVYRVQNLVQGTKTLGVCITRIIFTKLIDIFIIV